MNWRTLRWWLAGILMYGIFLLATLPAAYALSWFHDDMANVQLADVSGSVWSGHARELVLKGQAWGALRWHFDWLAPFTGRLGYRLQLHGSDLSLKGRIAAGHGALLLQDIRGRLPVGRIDSWLPLPEGSVSGTLELQLRRVLLVKLRPQRAEGEVTLSNVVLHWPEVLALGDYRMNLRTLAKQGIQGQFKDLSGPLGVQGTAQFSTTGQYQISGRLTGRDQSDTTLNQLLADLPTDGSGHHTFHFSGRW